MVVDGGALGVHLRLIKTGDPHGLAAGSRAGTARLRATFPREAVARAGAELLLEGLDGRGFVVLHVEHGVELGDL
jgi:hypothetical protein